MKNKLYFWLSQSGISHRKQNELLGFYGGIEELYKAVRDKNPELHKALSLKDVNKLYYISDKDYINKEYNEIINQGVEILTPESALYPDLLRQEQVGAPNVIYLKGNSDILTEKKIAIVGTRRCTDYGAKTAKQFASALALSGLCIVSGMADGIDTFAHEAALECGGKTIAVLAGGFNHIYPYSNINLSKRIIKDGLLLSEYAPDVKSVKFTFPARNRIISGLSLGVLVVEGGDGSGSLITADYAIEQNRELFLIPGRIDSPNSAGTNALIKAVPHAMVLSPQDILKTLKINTETKIIPDKHMLIQLDILDEMVYNSLKDGEKHFNQLLEITKTDPVTLNSMLANLEMRGVITKKFGNKYTL